MTTDESRPLDGAEEWGTGEGPPGDAEPPKEEIPLGQRIFDSPFLLLVAGIVIMLIFYTGWGLWEIMTLPEAPLP